MAKNYSWNFVYCVNSDISLKSFLNISSGKFIQSDIYLRISVTVWADIGLGLFLLTLKVLNFWKFTSYCSLKPLWSGMGEVVPARTSPTLHPPIPSHCASIVTTSTLRVNMRCDCLSKDNYVVATVR